MKTCVKCREAKPRSEFHKHCWAKDGHRTWCKTCVVIPNKAYRAINRDTALACTYRWKKANPLRLVFHTQKYDARRRDIKFRLTFEQWLTVWKDSGKLVERGRKAHEYVMGRYSDVGAYEIGNVYICTAAENCAGPRGLAA